MKSAGEDPATGGGAGPATILVVDDDKHLRRSVAGCLADAGWGVLEAPGGAEALETLGSAEGTAVEVVFLDVRMPNMDGIEVFRRILEIRPRPRVVFLTGERERRVRDEALRLGAYDFLEKPPTEESLTAAARHASEAIRLEREVESLRSVLAPAQPAGHASAVAGEDDPFSRTKIRAARDAFEKLFILRRLAENAGNIVRTARQIGMDRTSLYRKIRLFGVKLEDVKAMRKEETRTPDPGSGEPDGAGP